MDASRRTLIIFGTILGLLVIAVTALVFLTNIDDIDLMAEDSPEGTVQRYLIAIHENRYQDAFSFLKFSPEEEIDSYQDWLNRSVGWPDPNVGRTWKATLGTAEVNTDKAVVGVIIDTFRPGGLFEDPINRQDILFSLQKDAGKWFITSPVHIYWIY
ncbi:MAG: hypothetical protein WCS74_05090 [Dehalococcoidales bacterium]|jgi:hypothetical protein